MKYLTLNDNGDMFFRGENIAEVATEFERQHIAIQQYLEAAEEAFKNLENVCNRAEELHLSLSIVYEMYIGILKKAGIR